MITCERCHTENLDGSQYCDECGAILPGQPPPRRASAPDADPPRDAAPEAPEEALPPETRDASESGSAMRSQVIAPAARTSVSASRPSSGLKVVEPTLPRDEAAAEAVHAKFVIERGRSVGKEFPLNDDEAHIGRWDADGGIFPDVDLDPDDPEAKVSRRHARITRRGAQYFIEDLGSTNGTFINRGRRLLPGDRQPLRDGDEVIVGKTFLRFHVLK